MSIPASGQFSCTATLTRRRLAETIAHPDTQLVRLDASASDAAAELQRSLHPYALRLVVAIHGGDADRRRQLNNQIAEAGLTRGLASVQYISLDERFPSPNDWLAYLREVTDRRRHDLWIRFTTSGGSTTLREDRYEYVEPWHLFVLRVYRPGLPGERSQLAIVRQANDVTKAAVIRSTEIIARGDMTFCPMRLKKGG